MSKNKRSWKKIIPEVFDELNKSTLDENDLSFNSLTSKLGKQIILTQKYLILINEMTESVLPSDKGIFSDNRDILKIIDKTKLQQIMKQVVIDNWEELNYIETEDVTNTIKQIKDTIRSIIEQGLELERIFYYPASTLGFEKHKPLEIGNITITSREHWIQKVNFPAFKQENHIYQYGDEIKWKQDIEKLLNNNDKSSDIGNISKFAEIIYPIIKQHRSVISISLPDMDTDYAHRYGKILAQTVLDSISLLFNKDCFHQQILSDERIESVMSYKLLEINNYLSLPGKSLSNRVPIISGKKALSTIENNDKYMNSLKIVLGGVMSPNLSKHPKLSERWVTALHWYAEGCRELHDYIALPKMATALDILFQAGSQTPITVVFKKIYGDSSDIENLVKRIYGDGRSQILHGLSSEKFNRLEEARRESTRYIREVLIRALMWLPNYDGVDDNHGFRKLV
ncbi:hypothetical protein B9T10_07280 [Wohlfahrtiimonas chitiniclastica]|uniref:hypothetical protein n=1 Tax=Wohlfahrtiimonas chitiniclastica TaxID=400946 RepID=UPI000B97F66E|nr:hypothetical protein [Wohlfahrtiimonas chitiniclastica]OYQ89091.1 hypothetical protein B9T10_07280 [Wohlfahrtiimonas chitiniclastica]